MPELVDDRYVPISYRDKDGFVCYYTFKIVTIMVCLPKPFCLGNLINGWPEVMYKHVIIGILSVLLVVMTVVAAYQYSAMKRMTLRLESAEARLKANVTIPSDSGEAARRRGVAGSTRNGTDGDGTFGGTGLEGSPGADSSVSGAPVAGSDGATAKTPKGSGETSADSAAITDSNVTTMLSQGGVSSGRTTGADGKKREAASEKEEKDKDKNSPEQGAAQSNALLIQAQQRIQDGDYGSAEALLQQSLEQDTGNARAWKQLAQLQRQLGLTEDEFSTYQQWMDSVPDDNDPYYMLAESYTRMGMDEEARQYLLAYESMAQGTTGDYIRMSHLYRSMNAREDEGRILSQWTQTAPDSMDARNAWADYQRRMGNYGEALSQYEAMAAATPENPLPYRQMAEIYRRNGDYVQAEQQYATALSVRPGDISTMNRLADVRYTAGDLNGALNVYNEIIALEPGSRAAEQAERRAIQIERRLQQVPQ